MRLKPVILSTNDLKKNTYKVLCKMHTLENKKNIKRFYSKKYDDEYYVVLVVNHIKNIMDNYSYIFSESVYGKEYLNKLNKFYQILQNSTAEDRKLNSKDIVSLLKYHTKTFNDILSKDIKINMSEVIHTQWTKCIRAKGAVWGN